MLIYLGLTCLAQGHNAVTPVRLKPAAFWSRVKHYTTALPYDLIGMSLRSTFWAVCLANEVTRETVRLNQ